MMAEHARPLISLLSSQFLFIKRLLCSSFSVLITLACHPSLRFYCESSVGVSEGGHGYYKQEEAESPGIRVYLKIHYA